MRYKKLDYIFDITVTDWGIRWRKTILKKSQERETN